MPFFPTASVWLPGRNSLGHRRTSGAQEPLLFLARDRRSLIPPLEHRPQMEARGERRKPLQCNRERAYPATDETRMEPG